MACVTASPIFSAQPGLAPSHRSPARGASTFFTAALIFSSLPPRLKVMEAATPADAEAKQLHMAAVLPMLALI